ncbi:MAG: VCBS repeat-containing protein [Granulosicoccaceae bacterium]
MNVVFRFATALVLLLINSFAFAQYPPITDLWRLSNADYLAVDRGGPVDMAGDMNGDGIDDVIIGSGVGGVRIVFGPTRGHNGVLNAQQLDGDIGFAISHDSQNISHVSGVGDVNNDGLADVIVGSLGGAHVVFGSSSGFPRTVTPELLDGANGFSFTSAATSVSGGGDINSDGIADIIVGNANASSNGQVGSGVTYVIYGSTENFPAVLNPAALSGRNGFAIVGVNSQDRSGAQVADAGDYNHDGFNDILIGAPNKTQDGRAEAGEAYLVLGRDHFPAAVSLADIDGNNGFVFKGNNIQDSLGASVSGIGDINHDGIGDIAIGAPGKGPFGSPSDYPGETYVLFGGNFSGERVVGRELLTGANGFVARGIRGGVVPIEEGQAIWGDLSGTSLDAAGDFNHDGIDDLIIGASHTIKSPSRKGSGQAYIIYGSNGAFSQRLNLRDLDGSNGMRFDGTGTTDYFAVYVRQAGDFNADGRDDVIIGASGQGESYVMYSRDAGPRFSTAPNVAFNAQLISSGFPATLNQLAADARPLAFNELRDPTGPRPLPPGTSVVLGDPATPGDIPAYVGEPILPPRPTEQPNTQVNPDVQNPVIPPQNDGTEGADSTNAIKVGTGGTATHWMLLSFLTVLLGRINRHNISLPHAQLSRRKHSLARCPFI